MFLFKLLQVTYITWWTKPNTWYISDLYNY